MEFIKSKNLEKHFDKPKIINNYEKKIIKKQIINKKIYITSIKIPEEITLFLINSLKIMFQNDINLIEEIKKINKKNIKIAKEEYQYCKDILDNNEIEIETINKTITKIDIDNIQKVLWNIIEKIKKIINEKIISLLIEIEEKNCERYCLKCKYFINCGINKNYEIQKCKYLYLSYLKYKKELDNNELQKHNENIISFKENLLKELNEQLDIFKEIENLRKFFNIKTKNNQYIKNYTKNKINFILKNEDYKKTKFLYNEHWSEL